MELISQDYDQYTAIKAYKEVNICFADNWFLLGS